MSNVIFGGNHQTSTLITVDRADSGGSQEQIKGEPCNLFEFFPPEILREIFRQLDSKSAVAMSEVCLMSREVVKQDHSKGREDLINLAIAKMTKIAQSPKPPALYSLELVSAHKEYIFLQLAKNQAVENPTQALAMVNQIECKSLKISALCELAKELASIDPEYAKQLLEEAKKVGSLEAMELIETQLAIAEAEVLFDPQQAQNRLEQVLLLPEIAQGREIRYFNSIAKIMAKTDLERAIAILEGIPNVGQRLRGIAQIAKMQAAVNPQKAKELCQKAIQLFHSLQGPKEKAASRYHIVRALFAIDPDEALSKTELMRESSVDEIVELMSEFPIDQLIKMYIDEKLPTDTARALEVANLMRDPSRKSEALFSIAMVLAPLDPDKANELCNQALPLANHLSLSKAHLSMAKVQAITDKVKANELFRNLIADSTPMPFLMEVTLAMAQI